jgi:hypothetical protein
MINDLLKKHGKQRRTDKETRKQVRDHGRNSAARREMLEHGTEVFEHQSGRSLYLGGAKTALEVTKMEGYDKKVRQSEWFLICVVGGSNYHLKYYIGEKRLVNPKMSCGHLFNLASIIERILKGGGARRPMNVLVYCSESINRSPASVIAYLIVKKGFTYLKAFNYLKFKGHPKIRIWPGYGRALVCLEKRCENCPDVVVKEVDKKSVNKYTGVLKDTIKKGAGELTPESEQQLEKLRERLGISMDDHQLMLDDAMESYQAFAAYRKRERRGLR